MRDWRVAAVAGREAGVLGLDELRECGLDRQAVLVRARNGRLHRLYRGVYAVGHVAVPRNARFLAAVKACGSDAVLSHHSAAALLGLADHDEDRLPDVTIPHSARRHVPGVRIHRTVRLRDHDWLLCEGIPTTTPARTVIDLSAHLSDRALRALLREALGKRRLTLRALLRAIATAGPRPGMRRLRRVIADGIPTRSELEEAVKDLLEANGFEPPEINVPLQLDGRTVIPDFRWPAERVVVEADGRDWHDNPLVRSADLERQRLLEAHGDTVVRVTWAEVAAAPARTCRRIEAAGAPRRRSGLRPE